MGTSCARNPKIIMTVMYWVPDYYFECHKPFRKRASYHQAIDLHNIKQYSCTFQLQKLSQIKNWLAKKRITQFQRFLLWNTNHPI